MPSATGRSMLTWRSRRSRHALPKKGAQEKNITGRDNTHEAHRNKCMDSAEMSPGADT